jgi:SsrA-binding protein
MAKSSSPSSPAKPLISENRRARHDYTIERVFEAGLVLQGWEVKSLRAGRGQIGGAYVTLHRGEAWLLGSNVAPLISCCSHIKPEPERKRKLLLQRRELNELIGLIERRHYTLVPLTLYWQGSYVKLSIALAKGKKQHDKREAEKTASWQREQQRLSKKLGSLH